MAETFVPHAACQPFLDIFTQGFTALYQNLEPCEKPRLLRVAPTLFRKWAASPLLDKSILSPNNLIATAYSGDGYTAALPVFSTDETGTLAIGYRLCRYTLENHPVFGDLQRLWEAAAPYAECTDRGQLTAGFLAALTPRLSLADPFYAEFLGEVAQRLGLLAPLPAIGRRLLHPAPEGVDFFHLPVTARWQRLISAALENAVAHFQDIFVYLEPGNPGELFRTALTERMPLNELLTGCYPYMSMGLDPFSPEAAAGKDPYFNNIVLHLGAMLDRWLITPFGYYLRLINPLYYQHYNFLDELNYVCDSLPIDPNASLEAFSLGLLFDHTLLGRELFPSQNARPPYQKMPPLLPLRDIWQAYHLTAEAEDAPEREIDRIQQETTIYTLRLQYSETPEFWKRFQWPGDLPLCDLHQELADLFDFDPEEGYCFRSGEQEFSPQKKGRLRIRRSPDCPLAELALNVGDHLTYRSLAPESPALLITLEACAPGRARIRYPRLIDQSPALSEYERTLYEYTN